MTLATGSQPCYIVVTLESAGKMPLSGPYLGLITLTSLKADTRQEYSQKV